MRRRAGLFVALVLPLAVAACGDDGGDNKAERTDESTTSTSTSTTTATVPPTAATTPATTPAPDHCATAEEAAMSLHDSWVGNDADGAHACATDAAVDKLFTTVNGPAAGEYFAGCSGGPPATCSYAHEGGAINFLVSGSAANGSSSRTCSSSPTEPTPRKRHFSASRRVVVARRARRYPDAGHEG